MSPSLAPRVVALAVASLLAGLCHTVQAAAVTLTADSAATANGNVAVPSSWSTPPDYVNSSSNAFDGFNQGSGYAFARSNGAYAVSSSAAGIGSGHASTSLLFSFTNTGIGQTFAANFHLYGGSVGNSVNSALAINESLLSSYSASIKVGGSVRYATSATVTTTSAGSSLATSGTVLNPADDAADGFYNWNALDLVLDLGFLNTGETVDILAELASTSTANVGTYSYDCGGGGYGGYGGYGGGDRPTDVLLAVGISDAVVATGTCENTKGRSSAFYGDPLTIAGLDDGSNALGPANQGAVNPTNAVPEPGALALVGLALAGLGLSRRHRR